MNLIEYISISSDDSSKLSDPPSFIKNESPTRRQVAPEPKKPQPKPARSNKLSKKPTVGKRTDFSRDLPRAYTLFPESPEGSMEPENNESEKSELFSGEDGEDGEDGGDEDDDNGNDGDDGDDGDYDDGGELVKDLEKRINAWAKDVRSQTVERKKSG